MPVKSWNDAEKLTLLRTAIACSPNFKLDAAKVAEMWPGDDENAKPNARNVRDNFRSIMKHAEDLEALRLIKQEAAAKDEDDDDDRVKPNTEVNDAAPTSPKSSTPKFSASKNTVTTPRRGLSFVGKRPATDKPSTGSKRKRRTKSPCSDDAINSASETTSGDEADIDTPTPLARKTLPVRKTRRAAGPVLGRGSGGTEDEEEDAGAWDQDTEGSDGEYDLAKERELKAARKAKLARRARK